MGIAECKAELSRALTQPWPARDDPKTYSPLIWLSRGSACMEGRAGSDPPQQELWLEPRVL